MPRPSRSPQRRSVLSIALVALVAALAGASAPASAQQASASGAVGGGVFGSDAAASAELGVDLSGERYSLGVGGRLQWVNQHGLRSEDWDSWSERVAAIRYATYTHLPGSTDGVRATAALGALGDAQLGHGAVINGFTTGLDVDRRRLGAQLRVAGQRFGLEVLIDDVAAPRVGGARGSWSHRVAEYEFTVGATAAADLSAPYTRANAGLGDGGPDMPGDMPGDTPNTAALATRALPMAVIDGSVGTETRAQSGRYQLAGALYTELAAIATLAAGLHTGLAVNGRIHDTYIHSRTELHLGTDEYLPSWVGPLYERDRGALGVDAAPTQMEHATQLDRARAGGLGGLGGQLALALAQPGVGELAIAYHHRDARPNLATVRLSAPYRDAVQGALWAAIEPAGGARTFALELRVKLPQRMFVRADAARQYRHLGGLDPDRPAARPWWIATLAVGAAVDFATAAR